MPNPGFSPNQAARAVQQQFDQVAHQYDQHRSDVGWCGPEVLQDAIEANCPRHEFQNVVDIACGTGQASSRFHKPGCSVIGLDISSAMLAVAKKNFPDLERLAQFEFSQPLSSVGIKPNSMNLVICSGSLHYAEDLQHAVSEMADALAPGGVLAIDYLLKQDATFGPQTRPLAKADVDAALAKAGLAIVHNEQFVGYYQEGDPARPLYFQTTIAKRRDDLTGGSF
ncbi:methyltransferase domain-containing protein [Oligoflexia bacterium]|nr:methyltransferase domain-containing protein [Oligoflexia bacterium]